MGRPSVADERRLAIVESFINLVAEHGVTGVTLDQVASAAGVQRAVVRHYVGNKDSLVTSSLRTLVDRYTGLIRDRVGNDPFVDTVLDLLFSRKWTHGMGAEDRALNELFRVAMRDTEIRDGLKSAYQLLIDELGNAIRREQPDLTWTVCTERAYAVTCLADHNSTLQQLGMPERFTLSNRRAAEQLIRGIGPA